MSKSITLKHIGYRCLGTALINLWDGKQCRVNMDAWDIDNDDTEYFIEA